MNNTSVLNTYDKKLARRERVRKFLRTMFGRKVVIAAAVMLFIFIFIAVFASVLTPYDPNITSPYQAFEAPSSAHWLGCDEFGRDVLTRLFYGARVSLIVGVLAVIIACVIGVFLGLCAAYFGGVVDVIIMRCSEALMSIPRIMVSIALIVIIGSSITDLAIILAIPTIPGYIRMIRGQALSLKNSDYVKAAEMQGANSLYVMLTQILPNAISPIIVMMTQQVGTTILMESGLSYVGIGIKIPIASWGTMISNGKNYLITQPMLAIIPGICVALLVICLNVLGDGVRDAMDPRLRGEA